MSGLSLPACISTVDSGDLGPSGWDAAALDRRNEAFFHLGPLGGAASNHPDCFRVFNPRQVHSLCVLVLLSGKAPLRMCGHFDVAGLLKVQAEPLHTGSLSIMDAAAISSGELARLIGQQEADGVVTDLSGVYAAVTCADCLGLLLTGELPVQGGGVRPVIGALHSGWGGTGILALALHALAEAGAGKLRVLCGPCIAAQAYPVPRERAALFAARFGEESVVECPDGQPGLDLVGANLAILAGRAPCLGTGDAADGRPRIPAVETVLANRDTVSSPDLHSYRREGPQNYGRMLAMIGPVP